MPSFYLLGKILPVINRLGINIWKQQFFILFVLLNGNIFYLQRLLSLHVFTMAEGCPVRPLIKPCVCNEITKGLEIVCEGVQLDTLREVFNNLQTTGQAIVYLKMKNNYIRTFPSNLLNNISVRHLMAHKCNMVNLDQFAFFAIRDAIESLDLSQNKFNKIPSALKGLSSLVSLNLNYNQIESIEQGAFEGLTSLLRLSLFGNKIVHIHSQAFIGIGLNLTRINLGGNQLSSVPSDALKDLKSIQRLQIHENRIHTLQRSDFAELKALEHLDVLNLANNLLEQLEADVFFDLKALNSIDLELNQISILDKMAFNGIQDTLEWLKLDSNQLSEIPSEALRKISKLRELDLKNNLIKQIKRHSFEHFGKNIKFLYLQKNRIDFIEDDAFDNLGSLEWLYLNSNKLKSLPRKLFEKVMKKNLTILDLHDNPLTCSCEIEWYKQWIEENEKNQMAHVWKETKCYYDDETQKSEHQSKKEIYLIEIKSMMKCNGFMLKHSMKTQWFMYILLAITIISANSYCI